MPKVQPTPGPGVPILGPVFRLVFAGPGRRLAPLWTVALVVGLGAYWGWSEFGPHIVASPQYHVTSETIVVTPPPAWIKADVKLEALRDASIDLPVSVLDDQLVERIARAFAFHPWVASVARVQKSPPASVVVELAYRKPVCMVELPDRSGLYAVDGQATLLPSRDFLDDPQSPTRYPRLSGVSAVAVGRVGAPWADPLVVGGAAIAAELQSAWTELGLQRIAQLAGTTVETTGAQFELHTRRGSRIAWGSPPGREADGEMTSADKVAALRRYVADHGSLEGRDGPQRLDLRGAHVVVLAMDPEPSKSAGDAATKPGDKLRK